MITSGLVGEWTSGRGRGKRQWKSAKVERWTGRISGRVGEWTGGRGRGRRQCEGAKVQKWEGDYEWASGLVDWGAREAVGKCKSAKVGMGEGLTGVGNWVFWNYDFSNFAFVHLRGSFR